MPNDVFLKHGASRREFLKALAAGAGVMLADFGLSTQELQAINHGNAEQLFPRLRG